MRIPVHPLMAAPLLLVALAGSRMLQQPLDRASAYNGGANMIYTAPLLNAATVKPASGATIAHLAGDSPIATAETANVPALQPAMHQASARVRLSPASGFSVVGGPTISPGTIDRVLASYGSPMAGEGGQLYQLGVKYGIDPAFCLAFFIRESDAGTQGEAVLTHNLGNIRAVAGAPALDGYRYYDTWLEGAEDWYRLIRDVYVRQWGLTTVSSILPVYAPVGDNNDPTAYIDGVERMVTTWRAQR